MYCPKCGAKNSDETAFCVQCSEPFQLSQGVCDDSETITSHLVPAILCTLFCCVPLGIVALVYAAQVDSKLHANDFNGAQYCSEKAALWCWWSFGLGLAGILIYGMFFALTAVLGHCRP